MFGECSDRQTAKQLHRRAAQDDETKVCRGALAHARRSSSQRTAGPSSHTTRRAAAHTPPPLRAMSTAGRPRVASRRRGSAFIGPWYYTGCASHYQVTSRPSEVEAVTAQERSQLGRDVFSRSVIAAEADIASLCKPLLLRCSCAALLKTQLADAAHDARVDATTDKHVLRHRRRCDPGRRV